VVDIYDSDRDQVEALRKWWKENGKSIVLGVGLGLAAVLGWRAWQDHQHGQAVAASVRYQHLLDLAASGDPRQAAVLGEQLVASHPGTLYAALTGLLLARIAADQGDLDAATRHLDAVLAGTALEELAPVARLQKARVLLAQNKLDEALAATTADAPAAFRPAFAELRGDVLAARGDAPAARQAYLEALQGLDETAPSRALVRMKLDDLGQPDAAGEGRS
jgi:predicted negative regulator of RcsB-dependent stress response